MKLVFLSKEPMYGGRKDDTCVITDQEHHILRVERKWEKNKAEDERFSVSRPFL